MVPPASADSDIELDDDTIGEVFDDEVVDPDFFADLHDDDDFIPTASGKHTQCILEDPVCCLGCLFWCHL